MEYDLVASPRDAYRMLTSVVVPRPIALVTTVGADGAVNAAPYSFFNLLGSDPAVVGVGVGARSGGARKDTAANAEASGAFVVNLVDYALREPMNVCAVDFPPGVSEPEAAALALAPSVKVTVPRLADAPASLECVLREVVTVGSNRILLGEVVYLHIADDRLDSPTRVSSERLDLIGRMGGGGGYVRTTDRFELRRMTLAEWEADRET